MGMCLIDKELLWGIGEYMKCFSFTGNRFCVSGNFSGVQKTRESTAEIFVKFLELRASAKKSHRKKIIAIRDRQDEI